MVNHPPQDAKLLCLLREVNNADFSITANNKVITLVATTVEILKHFDYFIIAFRKLTLGK